MPRYDYECFDCQEQFELSLSLKEQEEKDTQKKTCPKCKSSNINQVFSKGSGVVLKHGRSKSVDRPAGCGGCAGGGGCPYSH